MQVCLALHVCFCRAVSRWYACRVGPQREIPDGVRLTEWARTGYPEKEIKSDQQHTTPVRTAKQIAGHRAACALGRDILDAAHRAVRPGVTTDEIDRVRRAGCSEACSGSHLTLGAPARERPQSPKNSIMQCWRLCHDTLS